MNEEAERARYRLERSRRTLADALSLSERGSYDSAINRLYYACFYAITAVLVLKGAKPRKHTAVRSAFNRDLVNSGVVPVDKAKVYNLLFDLRLAADYQDFFEANAESVRELSDESAELISILERHSHPLLD